MSVQSKRTGICIILLYALLNIRLDVQRVQSTGEYKYKRRKFSRMVQITLLSSGPELGMVSILSYQSLLVHLISFLSQRANKWLILQRMIANPPW